MKHPAKFSDPILVVVESLLPAAGRLLDPFAGTGKVHRLATPTLWTVGVELEPEWATMHPQTVVGNALRLPFADGTFDVIVTSPTYGNRMADHHEAKDTSRRMTYRHTLGRPLHPANSGAMQWGKEYRRFHEQAWAEAVRVLRPGGRFILNCSDHIRRGDPQPVTAWHVATLVASGLEVMDQVAVPTQRMRCGQNGTSRVDHEWVVALERTI